MNKPNKTVEFQKLLDENGLGELHETPKIIELLQAQQKAHLEDIVNDFEKMIEADIATTCDCEDIDNCLWTKGHNHALNSLRLGVKQYKKKFINDFRPNLDDVIEKLTNE